MPTFLPGQLSPWDIDSGEARRMARRIRSIAENIANLKSHDITPIRATVTEELGGRTADKLTGAIRSIERDVNGLVVSLNEVASSLTAYANRLEAADKEAGDFINRK